MAFAIEAMVFAKFTKIFHPIQIYVHQRSLRDQQNFKLYVLILVLLDLVHFYNL